MARKKHTRLRSFIGFGAVLTVVTAVGASQYGWWQYMTIAMDQATAIGTVLATSCTTNNDVSYSFLVNGSDVEGRESLADCRSLRPGDRLLVSFSSADPDQNMTGNAFARFLSETISILVATVLGSFVIAAVFIRPFENSRS